MAVSRIEDAPTEGGALVLKKAEIMSLVRDVLAATDQREETGVAQAQDLVFNGDMVYAINDRMAVIAMLPVDTGLELTVNAEDLLAVLRSVPEDELTIDLDDRTLTVSSATTSAGLVASATSDEMQKLLDRMVVRDLDEADWHAFPDDFATAVALCGISVSRHPEDVAFGSLRVFPDRVLSTDTWRVSRYVYKAVHDAREAGADAYSETLDFLLAYAEAKEVAKFGPKEFQVKDDMVYLRNARLSVAVRTESAVFPDCEEFLDVSGTTAQLPSVLGSAIQSVLHFAAGDEDADKEALLRFEKDAVVVRTERNDKGYIEKRVPLKGIGSKLPNLGELPINPVFVAEVLKSATSVTVGDGRVLFTAPGFEHAMNLPE